MNGWEGLATLVSFGLLVDGGLPGTMSRVTGTQLDTGKLDVDS